MPSTILSTMTEGERTRYRRLLVVSETQCSACTHQIKVGDLFMPLGDPTRALHCGECMVTNYASRVSHVETELIIRKNELAAVKEEVAAASRR